MRCCAVAWLVKRRHERATENAGYVEDVSRTKAAVLNRDQCDECCGADP